MKVLKFGGSSVRDGERIAHVLELIRAAASSDDEIAVVVSALGGVTDDLKDLPTLALRGEAEAHEHLARLEQRHLDALAHVAPKGDDDVRDFVRQQFDRLRDIASGVALLGECSPKTQDEVITFGERLSAPIVAAGLRALGTAAEACDAREVIVTMDRHGGARPILDETYLNIRQYFRGRTDLQVVTGFVARTAEGMTTHLGRGGSDLTAALLGAALEASAVEIWTDVDGVLTADPREVPEAAPIPEMSFEEVMELSHFGAKVIYPPTVQPVRVAGIDLSIRNTLNPSAPGTRIVEQKAGSGPRNPVVGIAAIDNVTLLRLEGDGMIGVPGTAGRLFQALAREEISVILISQASSEHSICFAIDPTQAELAQETVDAEFVHERRVGRINAVVVEPDRAVVAVVGEGMCEQPGISGRVFRVLGERGTNVHAIAQGSSERNISLVVDRTEKSTAVRAVHRAFFGDRPARVRVGVVGVGGVGSDLLAQLAPGTEAAERLELVAVASSRRMFCGEIDPDGWPEDWRAFLEGHGGDGDASALAEELQRLDGPRIFIDCSASPAVPSLYPELMRAGVRVVAANKLGFAADSDASLPLIRSGQQALFEATVGAGLPVISTLQDMVATGDEIHAIDGVLSGTLAYVLDRLQGGDSLSEAVQGAFDAGYTEPDPRDDLSGQDVARKLLILARVAGFDLEPKDLQVKPLLESDPDLDVPGFMAQLADHDSAFASLVEGAREKGQKLCYLARFDGTHATVGLEAIGSEHPCFSLSGTDNMVAFRSTRYSSTALVVRGPGAGTAVTAAGVLGDTLKAARQIRPAALHPLRRSGAS